MTRRTIPAYSSSGTSKAAALDPHVMGGQHVEHRRRAAARTSRPRPARTAVSRRRARRSRARAICRNGTRASDGLRDRRADRRAGPPPAPGRSAPRRCRGHGRGCACAAARTAGSRPSRSRWTTSVGGVGHEVFLPDGRNGSPKRRTQKAAPRAAFAMVVSRDESVGRRMSGPPPVLMRLREHVPHPTGRPPVQTRVSSVEPTDGRPTRPRNVVDVTVNANTSVAGGNTWRDLPAAQQPEYPDAEALRDVVADLDVVSAARLRGRVRPAARPHGSRRQGRGVPAAGRRLRRGLRRRVRRPHPRPS